MANTIDVILNFLKKGTGDKDTLSSLGKLNKGFKDLTGISLGAAGGIALLGKGLQEGVKLLKDSVNETVAYNKTVREMSQVTGLAYEDISRIIQVGDDWGISIDAIRTSLAFMNKQGVSPSIDNLAKMADEYVNSADKAAWAEQAVKTLGRGYQTLIPILAKGGDSLREQAAAIDDSLIATSDAIDNTREYEVAVDTLNDTWTGLKHTLGNAVIPALTSTITVINTTVSAQDDLWSSSKALIDAEKIDTQVKEDLNTEYQNTSKWIFTAKEKTEIYKRVLDEFNKRQTTLYGAEEKLNIARQSTIYILDKSAAAQLLYNDALDEYSKRSPLYLQQYAAFTQAQKDAGQAIYDANLKLSDFKESLDGAVGNEIADFNQSQDDTVQKMQDVQGEIDILNGKEYLTPEQQTELDNLKQEQTNLQTEYGNNAIAHTNALHQILIDIALEKIATSDLTDSQKNAANDMIEDQANKWGLIDTSTHQVITKVNDYIDAVRSGNMDDAKAILNDQQTSWQQAGDKANFANTAAGYYRQTMLSLDGMVVDTTINTYHNDYYEETGGDSGGGGGGRRATGGPVSAGQAYWVGEQGVELFVPNQNGTVIPNSTINNNQKYTMNIHTNAPSSTLMGEFRRMKAMAG